MASHSPAKRPRKTKLRLDDSGVEILWRDQVDDAALAQLLLRLIGEDGLRQAMRVENSDWCAETAPLANFGCKKR